MRNLLFALGGLLALLLLGPASPALADTYTVNTTVDALGSAAGNGKCETAPGNGVCTLRRALVEANLDGSTSHTISVPAGYYRLTLTGNSGYAVDGPLVMYGRITVNGAGAGQTIIDGNKDVLGKRVVDVAPGATVSIRGVSIRNGRPTTPNDQNDGGAVRSWGALTLTDVEISGGEAGTVGGGIYLGDRSTATLTDVTIKDNQAAKYGGGVFADTGVRLTMTNVTLSGNNAVDTAGGALFNNRGPDGAAVATLTNVTVHDNIAGKYGGAVFNNATLTLVNGTITDNRTGGSSTSGGGLFNNTGDGGPGSIEIRNTIVANNSNANCVSSSGITSRGGNLESSDRCGFRASGDQVNASPQLGSLQDNGGPVATRALQDGSPAIDGGVSSGCPGTDARGITRPRGSACDIGAYERQGASQPAALAASYSSNPPTGWQTSEQRSYSVQVTNTGSQTWNAGGANPVRLGVHFATSASGWSWATDQRFVLPNDVAPGQSATLTVGVRAPASGGAYFLQQRLVKEGVVWFDQEQTTSVTVSAAPTGPPLAASYSSSPPTTWDPGQQRSYNVQVTNTGSQTWNAGGANPVRLGVHFGTSSDGIGSGWATDQRFSLSRDVAPGESLTLTVGVRAPTSSGSYVLRHRLVQEGVVWFSQIQKTSVTVGGPPEPPPPVGTLKAAYDTKPSSSWNPGQVRTYRVTVKNVGTQTWTAGGANPVRLGVHFGQSSDAVGKDWATDQRFVLTRDVKPGESLSLDVQVQAPTARGDYVLRHRLVKEGVTWFDQIKKKNVEVK